MSNEHSIGELPKMSDTNSTKSCCGVFVALCIDIVFVSTEEPVLNNNLNATSEL